MAKSYHSTALPIDAPVMTWRRGEAPLTRTTLNQSTDLMKRLHVCRHPGVGLLRHPAFAHDGVRFGARIDGQPGRPVQLLLRHRVCGRGELGEFAGESDRTRVQFLVGDDLVDPAERRG